MGELVTEARVEMYHPDKRRWFGVRGEEGTVPRMVERGRACCALERYSPSPWPVRVVDSAGTVVAQWGRP